jgi:hypothetical protein
MKLPGGDAAVIDARKITDYILSSTHPRGRHKARVFFAALGLLPVDADAIVAALRTAAANEHAVAGETDVHGQRFVIDFEMVYLERTARVRSHWIVVKPGSPPRFVTAFVRD